MALVFRDYQHATVTAIWDYFASGKTGNPVAVLPTGTGKSVVIAGLAQTVLYHYPLERMMVLTHVKELIEQNFKKLLELWPTAPAGIYSAGIGRKDTKQKIIFGGIASVAKHANKFGHIGLLVVDEAHLVSPEDVTLYRKFIEGLRKVNPHVKVIGFTATPWRLGHGHISGDGSLFTDVCMDLATIEAFKWFIHEGYMCPLIPKSTSSKLDVDGVHMRGGEFIASELQAAVDKRPLIQQALDEAVHLAADRQCWLVFCAGVEHSVHVAEELNLRGITCKAVHSKISAGERDAAIADWKAGRLMALTNNNVLTTGIDNPRLDCIVVLRPTGSTTLWVQMLGRGTRPLYAPNYDITTREGRLDAILEAGKQNCLVLDFAGNTPRLGPINDPVIPKRKGETKGEAPVKLCPSCSTYNHASAMECIFCGHAFPRHAPIVKAHAGTDELMKLDLPQVETFRVTHVTYAPHAKPGKPLMMRVTYYGKVQRFNDYVLFEHGDQFSKRKAAEWWTKHAVKKAHITGLTPLSTEDALLRANAGHLRPPTHIRVWVNTQYPKVMDYCFDGSDFGKDPPETSWVPSINVSMPESAGKGFPGEVEAPPF